MDRPGTSVRGANAFFMRPLTLLFTAAAASLATPRMAQAQSDDVARTRWVFSGELTSVLSQGNSEAITLGLGSVIRHRRERGAIRFEAGAIRVETGKITRRAVGTAAAYTVTKDVTRTKTAESLYGRGRYDRTVSTRAFLFGGVDWQRNTFAGIDSRFLLAAGGGNKLVDSDHTRLSASYAITYTFQSDVVKNPFVDAGFGGTRVGWELWRKLSESAVFESTFVGDLNLKDTDDRRFDLVNSLSVDVNKVVALKPSLQLMWRNHPSLTEVPLYASDGTPTGTSVRTPLEKLDTFFRMALVFTF